MTVDFFLKLNGQCIIVNFHIKEHIRNIKFIFKYLNYKITVFIIKFQHKVK